MPDAIVEAIKTLADAQISGDRALLNLTTALIEKVQELERRLHEVECQLQCVNTGNRV